MSTPLTTGWRDVWSSAPAPSEEAGRRRLEVVPTRSQRRARPRTVYAVVAVATLFGIVVAQLLLSVLVTEGAYTVDALQAKQTELSRTHQAATEALGRAAAPQTLAAKAASLGMVANPNLAYLRLSDGKVLGSPAPAPAAQGAAATGTGLVPDALDPQADDAARKKAAHKKAEQKKDEAGNSGSARESDGAADAANVPFTGTLPSPTTH